MNKYEKLKSYLIDKKHFEAEAEEQVMFVALQYANLNYDQDTCDFISSPEFFDDKEKIYVTTKYSSLGLELDADLIKIYDTHKVFIAQDRIVITNNDNEEIKSWDVLNITLDDVQ